MRSLSLFFLTPILLHAGWFDWLYDSPPPKATQFSCPHHCGEWGSQSIQDLEWNFVLLLHSADLITFNGIDLELGSREKWLKTYPKPHSYQDNWCLEMNYFDRKDNMDESGDFDYYRLVIEIWDAEGRNRLDDHTYWGFRPVFREDKTLLGTIFMRKPCGAYYDLINTDSEKFPLGKRIYKCWDQSSYRLDHCEDFYQACADLKEDIDFYCFQGMHLVQKKPFYVRDEDGIDICHKNFIADMNRIQEQHASIFLTCAKEHNAPSAHYHIAIGQMQKGEWINALRSLECLYKICDLETLEFSLAEKVSFSKGQIEEELGLYDQAILSLGEAISKNPQHKDAYFNRAISYFETGEIEQAVADFKQSDTQVTSIKELESSGYSEYSVGRMVDFSSGLIQGINVGAEEGLIDFVPSTLSSISGLAHGLWAFALDPKQVSCQMVQASLSLIQYMRSHDFIEVAGAVIPEVKELKENPRLSPKRQGELIGTIIGRHGIDFLMCMGSIKGIKALKALKEANAGLTLEALASQIGKAEKITEVSKRWWKKTAPIIEDIKANGGIHFDQQLSKAFRNQHLSEAQVRKILHQAGFKTFPRPQGVPSNWKASISDNGGGVRYISQKNTQFEVRIMPGNPNSPNPAQRGPYVKHRTDKGYFDKHGQLVKKNSFESHIPLDEYNFEKLNQLVPYE